MADSLGAAVGTGGEARVGGSATRPAASRLGDVIGTVFVANRGEIARRIRRTTERLGLGCVVPATDGPGSLELLDIDAVVRAAVQAGADAVHPGFGFLAENADFADAVLAAGLRWVGPPPEAIRAMGDKGAARRLAERLDVPVVPGYDGAGQSDRTLRAAADRIGYPLLVKPAGGGGGKGMREVREPARLADALAGARREALASFGDDRLILERLVEGPRHVEVQVLFDGRGNGIHLGERDCSTQRRHQKVLEETPSPAVTPAIRTRLTHAALRLAAAVGYASAGTCEFLLTNRGEVFFLEMNTRLQVEHPVTELVTGLDLVELQLRVAAGERLPIDQATADRARERGGHAVEVRVYAEDAEAGFLPATGPVSLLRWPAGRDVRVDAGIDAGDEVTGRFDPMLAKVVGHGADRTEALDRLEAALDDTVVLGLVTNVRFLRWLVREPALRAGQIRIDSLDRIWPPDDWADRTRVPDGVWRLAAGALAMPGGESGGMTRRPTDWSGGWRLNAPARVRVVADVDDPDERTIALDGADGHDASGAPAFVRRLDAEGTPVVDVDVGGRSVTFRLAPPPDVDRAARAAASHQAGGSAEVVAPMPGAIIAVHHSVGDTVALADPLVTLEAMKMEHVVAAPTGGVVADLTARVGDQVTRGQRLAVVEPRR